MICWWYSRKFSTLSIILVWKWLSPIELHPITPTSPTKNVYNHLKLFESFCFFFWFFFFFFLSIIKDIMHGHIGDRKEITLLRIVCVCIYIYIYFKYLVLSCCASATPYRVRLLWFANKCSWLVCNNGEMVIYAFLLGFSILTIKIYDIKIKIVCLKTINNTHN